MNKPLQDCLAISTLRGYDVVRHDSTNYVVISGTPFTFNSFGVLVTMILFGSTKTCLDVINRDKQQVSEAFGFPVDYSMKNMGEIEMKVLDLGGGTGDILPFVTNVYTELLAVTTMADLNNQ